MCTVRRWSNAELRSAYMLGTGSMLTRWRAVRTQPTVADGHESRLPATNLFVSDNVPRLKLFNGHQGCRRLATHASPKHKQYGPRRITRAFGVCWDMKRLRLQPPTSGILFGCVGRENVHQSRFQLLPSRVDPECSRVKAHQSPFVVAPGTRRGSLCSCRKRRVTLKVYIVFQAYRPGDAPCRASINVFYVRFMCRPGKTCIDSSFHLVPSRVVAAGRSTSYIDTVGPKGRAWWLYWTPVAVPCAAVARGE